MQRSLHRKVGAGHAVASQPVSSAVAVDVACRSLDMPRHRRSYKHKDFLLSLTDDASSKPIENHRSKLLRTPSSRKDHTISSSWIDIKMGRLPETSPADSMLEQRASAGTIGQSAINTPAQQSAHALRKWISLSTLVLFTTATSVVSQRSRSVGPDKQYSIATSVFLSELLKFLLGFALATVARDASPTTDPARLPLFSADDPEGSEKLAREAQGTRYAVAPPSLWAKAQRAWNDVYCASTWMMGVPALIYVCQNMLQLAANSHLSPVAYQGLSQLKLITAALISVFVFGRPLSKRQWTCLPVLLLGVVFLTQKKVPSHEEVAEAASLLREVPTDSPFGRKVGSGSTLLSTNLMAQAASMLREDAKCAAGDRDGVRGAGLRVRQLCGRKGEWAPLRNFSTLAWTTVLLRGGSGYVVSATLRYADTIMKGFATSMAIITTIALESLLSSRLPTLAQLTGGALVMASTYNYVRLSATAKE
ncbi:hypothetical protein L1887_62278 [Cichorium endivia]|nr:hypothetical protein L1887_62278 [Cichorium endivia]